MNALISIFIGGGLGSVARYAIGKWITGIAFFAFPWGTLAANVISSLILGIFVGLTAAKPEHQNQLRFLVAIGFCGGFSTFSTFSAETFELFRNGMLLNGTINIFTNLASCLIMIGAGIWIGRSL